MQSNVLKDFFLSPKTFVILKLYLTLYIHRTLILKPPNQNPIDFIEESVLPSLKRNSEKKDLNQVTSAVVGSSLLLSEGTQNSSKIVPSLIGSTASLDAASVENIEQILNAFSMLSNHVSPTDIEKTSREKVHESLQKMVTLSKSFSLEGISLKDRVYDNFVAVLGVNIKSEQDEQLSKRKRREVTPIDDDKNYQLIQQVYSLVLLTTVTGESPKVLKSSYITANLQRLHGKIDRSLARNVGKCTVSYNINQVRKLGGLVEVSECSSLNPFTEVSDQQDIASLSLKNTTLAEISINNLPSHDVKVGIPASIESTKHLNLSQTIAPQDIIWTPIVNLTVPETGWNHSSIHIAIDTVNQTKASLNIHVAKLPNMEIIGINDHSMVVKTFESDENNERKRTVTILGR